MMWVYVALLLVGGAAAQIPFIGGCPKVDTVQDLDTQKYLGKWYEAERYFAFFEFGGKCVTATYTGYDNGTVGVVNRQISSLSGVASSIQGYATQKTSNKAKLSLVFPSMPVHFDAPYWVLDTDYSSYAVVWSCSDFGIFSTRNAWILTRERYPAIAVLEKAYQSIDKNKISRAFFVRTDQKNCAENAETNQIV
ncbi:PREDICTED: apolipoprotein D-like [Ceratosolen solmsi marchali]|uniref:Apolipoprotein D-like n=1 Tax=Ceratosolen solmsi marchali TaxID=326594 RepID=A0AAJ7E1K0_9HYME|nr:PREDICTED: apolipoprotein D-like [Ceratosolen solmsi marchali]XP_011504443.1 PREDICTED: apolipoprotein D-like [Ceratosolen solmsi marchali]